MEEDPDLGIFRNRNNNNLQWNNRRPPQNGLELQYQRHVGNRYRPQMQNRAQMLNQQRAPNPPQLQNHNRPRMENWRQVQNQLLPQNQPPAPNRQRNYMENQQKPRGNRRGLNRDEDNNERNDLGGRRALQKLGFKNLEKIAMSDPIDIIGVLNEKMDAFINLITNSVTADMHVLIIQTLAKVCMSSFDELKMKLLLEVVNTNYLMYLQSYLMELPYNNDSARNRLYWNNQNDFWKYFVTFCETIAIKMPSVAFQKCRSLIEGSSRVCLDGLNQRHKFVLSKENETKLADLRERLNMVEKKNEEEKQLGNCRNSEREEEIEPPNDFRQLSVIPSRDELLEERPYLRANVVRGGYRDIEHYLDVQFRLLREDCFGPLREGLLQYINDSNKKKYDNMRVYRNVKFIGTYIANSKTGFIIQLDENTNKKLKRINWAHSKRFIFGSLLLFSNDHCNSFITATVLDRDIKYISEGMIPVSIVENENILTSENIIQANKSFVMFESEVYFEPYFHVLRALQDPSFVDHVAMSKYIIDVEPTPRPPQYLHQDSIFTVETLESPETKFKVLAPDTWPTHEELKLNVSQFDAYQLALTNEFAVIQGPPGTGKTHLGVKVARTLLKNISCEGRCLLLIICYTNHALDQFLEHILEITSSIVRIGGQSRNKAMENISINNLRRTSTKISFTANKLFYSQKRDLKIVMSQLQIAQKQLESLSNGILTYDSLCKYVPEVQEFLGGVNPRNKEDKLMMWLLQNVDLDNIPDVLDEQDTSIEEYPIDTEDNINEVIIDDLTDEINEMVINGTDVTTSFMLHDAEQKIKLLLNRYKRTLRMEERHFLEREIRELHCIKSVFLQMRDRHRARGVHRPVRQRENLAALPNLERWAIYFTWANTAINEIRNHIAPLQAEFQNANALYEEARMNLDLNLLRDVKVVGMTTSGAARLRKLLTALAPPIVIVEEAAEVLEQHIVTSLTKNCKHLILIGDHQQLRPSAAYMKLARHFDIEVSLFERMIRNNINSRRLRVQHRMLPEISALISPHIYSDLENHPSVDGFPRVRGITANLFFYTHNYLEEKVEDGASRCNHKEADMTLGLANYLVQQDYKPEDVTILAAYSGQMFYMRKQRGKYAFLDKVKITVVDNYQGEESKIILLSLVRNNNENKIGFLGTENRICVALSRAKEGFYIFGNIDILKKNSPLWTKIAKTLEDGASIGNAILLKCENHPNQISTISSEKDFEKVPEGGCCLMCNHNLPACGHPCPKMCHAYDRSHSQAKCTLKCERVNCELGHVCPLKCAVPCRPCKVMVKKTLPCAHEMDVPCHREPTDPNVKCSTVVNVHLVQCGHEVKKPCHINIKEFVCPVPCAARVERCGHSCRRSCHVTDDPDHDKYCCNKPCAKAKKGCTANLVGDRGVHQCTKLCHETCDDCNVEIIKKRSNCKHSERIACCKDVDENPCRKNCARVLPCGHFCRKKCFEKCGDCNKKVTKTIPECNHAIKVECEVEPRRELCEGACERQLACGHRCGLPCARPCRAAACAAPAPRALPAPCGHAVRLPCNVFQKYQTKTKQEDKDAILLEWCGEACGALLQCGHACAGSCGACRQARLHAPCASACRADNICAHPCEEPCNQVCPPCKRRCEVKCPHSKCKRVCGAPCIPCQEKCSRRCPHGQCTNRCGEPCSRPPCDAACARRRRCGHRCRGLCGEPCPPICDVCSPDTFPKDFLGDDFDDDAKFIVLQDCLHILEVEDADNLMNGDKETITIRACPFCRKPIINTYRYKDRVNEMYRTEINPIKEKVYGTSAQVEAKKIELQEALAELITTHAQTITDNEHFKKAFDKIQSVVRTHSKMSLLQINMHVIYINTMDIIGEKIKNYKECCCEELKGEFYKQVQIICEVLFANFMKISQQQQADISNEIKRMGSMIQLSKMFDHMAYKTSKATPKVAEAAKIAKAAVLTWKVYKEHIVMASLHNLQDEIKVSGIVTKEERDMVVKAMGFKQGHWFKCPNGHFYCIADCGGAMVISKCNECGAQIGGERHTLLRDNQLAREMDGAQFAAWSEDYNNMANFHFD